MSSPGHVIERMVCHEIWSTLLRTEIPTSGTVLHVVGGQNIHLLISAAVPLEWLGHHQPDHHQQWGSNRISHHVVYHVEV